MLGEGKKTLFVVGIGMYKKNDAFSVRFRCLP